MNFVKLTVIGANDGPEWINLNLVRKIMPMKTGSRIIFSDYKTNAVRETPEEILRLAAPPTQFNAIIPKDSLEALTRYYEEQDDSKSDATDE